MHWSSLQKMRVFRDEYLGALTEVPLRIMDLGSTEMGACYRPIFDAPKWDYVGVDLTPGANVDLVLSRPYDWREIPSASVDVLISGQVLEHVEYFWLTALEIARVLKPGGLACLIAPSSGPEHRYPYDCWRFYPDGMRALAQFAHLHVLAAHTQWADLGDPGSDFWHDSVLVAQKPKRPFWKGLLVASGQAVQRSVLRWGLNPGTIDSSRT